MLQSGTCRLVCIHASTCVCVFASICISIHAAMHSCLCIFVCTHVPASAHEKSVSICSVTLHIYAHAFVCLFVFFFGCLHACICIYIYIYHCTHIYICICIYIYMYVCVTRVYEHIGSLWLLLISFFSSWLFLSEMCPLPPPLP